MSLTLYRGDVVTSASPDELSVREGAYLAVEDGVICWVRPELPEEFSSMPVEDFGRGLIIPAFSDLHIHASQYVLRGTAMDKLLFDWLQDAAFPQEARFADPAYAEAVYQAVVSDLIRHGTLHAALFTTLHTGASDILFRILAERGLSAYVGKVNMDCNSPAYLCEETSVSLYETERFLDEHQGHPTVKPILTPRFAPTCSRPLLEGLGTLAKKYACGVQTHLVESIAEAKWASELFPDCPCDGDIYERCGLLGYGPAIFAHVIFPSERDIEIIRRYKAVSVHCPEATVNITAGIMPADSLRRQGLSVALGTDIGAGAGAQVYRQIARAVQISKLKEFYEPEGNARITFANAFYMATRAGGAVFGNVGALEPGYRFDAVVLDHLEDPFAPLSPAERLERFCYAGDERNITARYLSGKQIDP